VKAISPVIATVIIVSVAIAISIAVALWLTGITSGFTQTENLEIIAAYANKTSTNPDTWNVTIEIKNTGTVAATIDNIFINGRPYSSYGTDVVVYQNDTTTTFTGNFPINPGQSGKLYIILKGPTFSSGSLVNIKIHTASGRDYPATVTLP